MTWPESCAREPAERPALDDALRRAERDRVDREARLLRELRSLERLQEATRLRAVGEEEDRHRALLVSTRRRLCERARRAGEVAGAAIAARPSGTRSVTCRPRSTAVWSASPIAVPPYTRNWSMSVDRRLDELVVLRRRRRHLRLAGEDDEPDPQVVGRLVEERAERLLRGAEPRRLDVLRPASSATCRRRGSPSRAPSGACARPPVARGRRRATPRPRTTSAAGT